MKHRSIIIAIGLVVGVGSIAIIAGSNQREDFSKVHLEFEGYSIVDGKRNANLLITNGSTQHISLPNGGYSCNFKSSNVTGGMYTTKGVYITDCSFDISYTRGWGVWMLLPPNYSSIAPGSTYRFKIQLDNAEDEILNFTLRLSTVPLRKKLPYALEVILPSSKLDEKSSFDVTTPDIPPAAPYIIKSNDSNFNILKDF